MPHLSKRCQRYGLIASLVLTLSIDIAPVALAKYKPPPEPSAPIATGTNTTRGGCDSNASVGLAPLVPFSHVGQTSSSRPTFVWFVPDRTPHPLQFRLFTRTGQPLYKTEMQSQLGIMQFSLPQNQPELAAGQVYRWQVELFCSPSNSLSSVVATADIEVVKPIARLQTQLAATQTPQQRIDLYAESGLWYDALAEALKAPNSPNSSPMLELLDSLASVEAQSLKDWSDRLKQIEAIERQRQAPASPPLQPKP
ncbi:MAG TPA: DUF928 domain-containing protein [Leptolyngbyaceae cyanobacterium M33_DOE_097]|uniref:DUF928 domain-containing protein n=1 Tax=Oscillatoriales cyanobacterium SpSt-418 TaxID=2282169 RepID=A0A7C3KDM1_9CYAN|nr:DUF928 domain-containing protein [Leptolyngbyaceae cyanobacterium M33_DOE_097]